MPVQAVQLPLLRNLKEQLEDAFRSTRHIANAEYQIDQAYLHKTVFQDLGVALKYLNRLISLEADESKAPSDTAVDLNEIGILRPKFQGDLLALVSIKHLCLVALRLAQTSLTFDFYLKANSSLSQRVQTNLESQVLDPMKKITIELFNGLSDWYREKVIEFILYCDSKKLTELGTVASPNSVPQSRLSKQKAMTALHLASKKIAGNKEKEENLIKLFMDCSLPEFTGQILYADEMTPNDKSWQSSIN